MKWHKTACGYPRLVLELSGRWRRAYSFALPNCPFFFAHSRRTFLWILPAALLGTSLTNTTPPVKYLCLATLPLIQPWISSELAIPSGLSVTYARGCSWAPNESWTPTTPASAMAGCVRRMASSSAGATCRPETLMSSWWVGGDGE